MYYNNACRLTTHFSLSLQGGESLSGVQRQSLFQHGSLAGPATRQTASAAQPQAVSVTSHVTSPPLAVPQQGDLRNGALYPGQTSTAATAVQSSGPWVPGTQPTTIHADPWVNVYKYIDDVVEVRLGVISWNLPRHVQSAVIHYTDTVSYTHLTLPTILRV